MVAVLGVLGAAAVSLFGLNAKEIPLSGSTKIQILDATPALELLSSEVHRACTRVWFELGSGHCEAVYQGALALALAGAVEGPIRREVPVPVRFDGQSVGIGYADIVWMAAGGTYGFAHSQCAVIFELKSVQKLLPRHESQLRAYMRGIYGDMRGGVDVLGALVNFPSDDGEFEALIVDGFER